MSTRFRWIFLVALFAALSSPLLRAEVSIDPQAGYVYADKGTTLLPANQLVVWVADVDEDGFGNWASLSGDSFLADPDDVVLGIGSSGSFQEGTITGTQLWTNVSSPDVVGKPFAMLWFALDYQAEITAPGEDIPFGFFNPGEVVPPDGTSAQGYSWLTQDVGGSLPNDSFYARYNTASGGTTSNAAPALDPIGDQAGDEGQQLSFSISAADPDGDDLTLTVTGLPTAEYFPADPQPSPATWTFAWTPSEAESGVYDPVDFTVSDGDLSDSESITLTVHEVNSAPVLTAIGSKTGSEGEELTFDLAATDSDIPANTLTYSASNMPAGASLLGNTFSWTPSDAQGGSSYNITFTVTDDGSPVASDSETIAIEVTEPVNHAPVAQQPTGLVTESGTTITLPLPATDEDGDALTLSIVSPPVNGSLATVDQAAQTVDYTPDAGFAGEDHFSFQASDGDLTSTVIDVFVLVVSPEGWLITLNLDGGDVPPALHLGVEPLATDGYDDNYDELMPGQSPPQRNPEGNFAGLYRPPATDPQAYFLRDIRQLDGDYLWILELDAAAEDLTVSWDNSDLPADPVLGITECDADGNPVTAGDPGVPLTNLSSLTVAAGSLQRYCIQPFSGEIEFDLTLTGGQWNLIALPLTPADPAVDALFADSNLTGSAGRTLRDGWRGVLYSGSVWDWDEVAQDYVAVTEIEPYQGYWVYIPEGQGGTITVLGQAAQAPDILHRHWNLMGVAVNTAPTNPALALSSLWKWVNGQYDKTTTLTPGLGHWVYSFEEGASLQSER